MVAYCAQAASEFCRGFIAEYPMELPIELPMELPMELPIELPIELDNEFPSVFGTGVPRVLECCFALSLRVAMEEEH